MEAFLKRNIKIGLYAILLAVSAVLAYFGIQNRSLVSNHGESGVQNLFVSTAHADAPPEPPPPPPPSGDGGGYTGGDGDDDNDDGGGE